MNNFFPHKLRALALLGIALLYLFNLSACQSQGLSIKEPWSRPTLKGANGAAYFQIVNNQNSEDRLLSVSGTIAEKIELHKSEIDTQGVMRMTPQESVLIPAGKTVPFEPGGLHVMLIHLSQELKRGETFPLTLHFEHFGDVQIEVEVP